MPGSAITDQDYLLREQYRDASNLSARAGLHERFSVNTYGWFRWVFDHLQDLPAACHVLELGCGPGWLWRENRGRVPAGWTVTLSDLSPGMIEQARANLRDGQDDEPSGTFRFQAVDAQKIPFADNSLDAVVANHMLYHVPDRPRALAEIRRVLKPGGRLFAATNGRNHMLELHDLVARLVVDFHSPAAAFAEFGLENGAEQLARWFEHVTMDPYEDGLVVTEAAPLIAYVQSSRAWSMLEDVQPFAVLVADELAAQGAIRIQKATGLFEAW